MVCVAAAVEVDSGSLVLVIAGGGGVIPFLVPFFARLSLMIFVFPTFAISIYFSNVFTFCMDKTC